MPSPKLLAGRTLVIALAAIILVLAVLVSADPAAGADWSSRIAATRRAQLSSEGSVLAADREIRRLERGIRQTRRKLRASQRKVARVRVRREAAREHLAETRASLKRARVSLAVRDAAMAAILPGSAPGAIIGSRMDPISPLAPLEPPTGDGRSADLAGWPGAGAVLLDDREASLPGVPPTSPGIDRVATSEIRDLERRSRREARQLRSLSRKTRRIERQRRARVRSVASAKRQRHAAMARRSGAEAALKSHIVAMSRLAQRRAAKKTKVRPGRSTPLVWPVRGRISQRYGCTGSALSPRRGACAHFHDGIDIVSSHGAPIRAAGVGVVSYVGRNPWDRGKRAFMVVIAHPGGLETLYAHVLPIRRVRVGQVVRRGEVIAAMGSTGHSTGTHLHLELRRGYSTIDPLAFL